MKPFMKICIAVAMLWATAFAQEPNVVWTRTYGTSGLDTLFSLRQTPDGGFIMAGVTGIAPHTKVYLIKVDCLGNIEWEKQPGPSGCIARHVDLAVENGYVVVGENQTRDHAFFMKFSPTGDLQRYVEYPLSMGWQYFTIYSAHNRWKLSRSRKLLQYNLCK